MKKSFHTLVWPLIIIVLCIAAVVLFYSYRETPVDTITLDSKLNAIWTK